MYLVLKHNQPPTACVYNIYIISIFSASENVGHGLWRRDMMARRMKAAVFAKKSRIALGEKQGSAARRYQEARRTIAGAFIP